MSEVKVKENESLSSALRRLKEHVPEMVSWAKYAKESIMTNPA